MLVVLLVLLALLVGHRSAWVIVGNWRWLSRRGYYLAVKVGIATETSFVFGCNFARLVLKVDY